MYASFLFHLVMQGINEVFELTHQVMIHMYWLVYLELSQEALVPSPTSHNQPSPADRPHIDTSRILAPPRVEFRGSDTTV